MKARGSGDENGHLQFSHKERKSRLRRKIHPRRKTCRSKCESGTKWKTDGELINFYFDKLTDFERRDIRRDGKLVLNSNLRNKIDKISVKNYSVKTGNYIRK